MFAADFDAPNYESIEALCENPAVEIVYVATPHQIARTPRLSRGRER